MNRIFSISVRILKIDRFLDPLNYAIRHGLRCGRGVTLSSKFGTTFGSEPYLIELGDYVRLSGNVTFITHDGGTWAFRDLEKYKDVLKFGKIVVGDRTFIGYGATIMPGVTIGKRCVVAAGAIVTKDIPDETVVAGIPARKVNTIWEYAEKCKKYSEKKYNKRQYEKNKRDYLIKREFNDE